MILKWNLKKKLNTSNQKRLQHKLQLNKINYIVPKCQLGQSSVYWFPNKKRLYLLLYYWFCSVLDISGPGNRGYCYNSGEPPSGQREGTVRSSHCYLHGKISIIQ